MPPAEREAERQARPSVRSPAQKLLSPPDPGSAPELRSRQAPPRGSGFPALQETAAKARQYFSEWDRWHRARGLPVNRSDRDYGVSCRLFRERHPRWQIREALIPLIEMEISCEGRQKKGRDYLDRTLDAAWHRVFG